LVLKFIWESLQRTLELVKAGGQSGPMHAGQGHPQGLLWCARDTTSFSPQGDIHPRPHLAAPARSGNLDAFGLSGDALESHFDATSPTLLEEVTPYRTTRYFPLYLVAEGDDTAPLLVSQHLECGTWLRARKGVSLSSPSSRRSVLHELKSGKPFKEIPW
jgi:hypothetical protein